MEDIVNTKNLSKIYKRRKNSGTRLNPLRWFNYEKEETIGVSELNISIKPGEKIGFLGPNGAGKSTFVKLVTGIIKPTFGEIRLFGLDPFANRKLCSQNYGVVFGNRDMLWKHVPVIESFKLAADIYRIDRQTFEQRLDLFDSVLSIKELLHVPPRKLSFGQRMKCQITYTLLHLPKIIIFDEATIGLDVLVRHNVIELLNKLVEEEGTTLIITSHLMEDVEKLADRLIVLNKGQIQYDGPKTAFIKQYGTTRSVKATFLNTADHYRNHPDLEKMSLSCTIDDNILDLECDSNKVTNILQLLATDPELEDIGIGEPALELILRRMFEEV